MVEIHRRDLHRSVTDPLAATMDFLNGVASRYPEAISLAAGRPYEGFHEVEDIHRYLRAYVDSRGRAGVPASQVRRELTQYGPTNGLITGLLAEMLEVDEHITVPPEAVMVTAGCQEAMVVAMRGLCADRGDTVLASTPCYVGLTGAARVLDLPVRPVPEGRHGLEPERVAAAAREVREAGGRPRLLYAVPNFANPSGASLSLPTRRRLLEVAAEEDLLILEDDPYGMFGLRGAPPPSLKALDTDGRVIYLGSFAKTCFPGARVGYLVADQWVTGGAGKPTRLAAELAATKSMVTLNTSALAQAVIAGMLLEAGGSVRAATREKTEFYRRNMRTLLSELANQFGPAAGSSARARVRWQVPDGGFFTVVEVPMTVDDELLELSARQYGVLWTPMSYFFPEGGTATRAVRLSSSWLPPDRIAEGVRRFARLVEDVGKG